MFISNICNLVHDTVRKVAFLFSSGLCAILLLSLVSIDTLKAQDGAYVHAGIGLSAIRSPATSVNFSKLNVLVGAGVMVPTDNKQFYFGFELNLAQKGNNVLGASQAGFELTRANLFYLQVPAYAAYSFNKKVAVFAGPAIGLLLYNSEENLFSINNQNVDFRSIEVSALAGVKLSFTDKLGGMIRIEHSLLNIYAVGPELSNIPGARRYNALAAFTLYYRIG